MLTFLMYFAVYWIICLALWGAVLILTNKAGEGPDDDD